MTFAKNVEFISFHQVRRQNSIPWNARDNKNAINGGNFWDLDNLEISTFSYYKIESHQKYVNAKLLKSKFDIKKTN